ncbi:MAG: hypothetical protein IT483_11465 [Gammaproteobacteria bacterium]|nr:hypothetical protein [Gammaproteobacteria bacterium]
MSTPAPTRRRSCWYDGPGDAFAAWDSVAADELQLASTDEVRPPGIVQRLYLNLRWEAGRRLGRLFARHAH